MNRHLALFTSIFLVFFLQAQTREGLVGAYTFNSGDAMDEVTKTLAKTRGINWSADRFGNRRSAICFQGNFDSYLNLGVANRLKPAKATISLWVYMNQPVYKGEGIKCNPIIYTRSHDGDDFNEAYIMDYNYDLQSFGCNTSFSETKQITIHSNETANLRQWYHLVMTYDDSSLCFYIDGILEGRATKNFQSKFLDGDSVLVGIHYGPKNKRYSHAVVDDIYIYNRALSPMEVMDLYEASNPNRFSEIMKWAAYCLITLLFFLFTVVIVRWRIRKAIEEEKKKNQLRNNWYEQENKVLTAQMDPHFIFNSLNTIQQFIIINDNKNAQLYLSKFSRLLRMILESNLKDTISLAEEVKIIQQYLEIESLRFNNVFKYQINMEKISNPESTYIPRFLIQPFVENAVWHGLLPKDGEKRLTVVFENLNDKLLSCTIADNGVGRNLNKMKDEGNRSLAISFIKQRLQLMGKLHQQEYELTIRDEITNEGQSAGTTIVITIPKFNA